MRVYSAAPGKLDALHARFRDHTCKLFEKHGITNIGYWVPMDKDKGAENTLIYILAHKNREAAEQSWKDFRTDPEWIATRKFSEQHGALTATNGVQSVFMEPTDYSPMK